MTSKITITLDDIVIDKIDAIAAKLNLSRSACISMAISKYLEAEEKLPVYSGMLSDFLRLTGSVIKGDISPSDYQRQVDDISVVLDSHKK